MSLKCVDISKVLDNLCRQFDECPTKSREDFERFYGAVRAVTIALEQGGNVRCKNCHYWIHPKEKTEIYGKCGWTNYGTQENDFCSYFEQEV